MTEIAMKDIVTVRRRLRGRLAAAVSFPSPNPR